MDAARRCRQAEEGAAVAVAAARDEAVKAVAREEQAASEALRAAREEAATARALVKQVRSYHVFGGARIESRQFLRFRRSSLCAPCLVAACLTYRLSWGGGDVVKNKKCYFYSTAYKQAPTRPAVKNQACVLAWVRITGGTVRILEPASMKNLQHPPAYIPHPISA